jgi:hypothetical protein
MIESEPKKEYCDTTRHVFKETNYYIRKGIPVPCQCGMMELRLFAYQDIVRDNDPLILQEFEVRRKEEKKIVDTFYDPMI